MKLRDTISKLIKKFLFKSKFYSINTNIEERIKFRYQFVNIFSKNLIKLLNIDIKNEVNLSENISYKVAGYNIGLDWYLLTVVFDNIRYGLFKLPFVIYLLNKFIDQGDRKYEIIYDQEIQKTESYRKFDNVFFASMNNYLNPIIPVILDKKNSILIMPAESKKWINYQKVLRNKIEHIFIENFLNFDKDQIIRTKKELKKNYEKNKIKILKFHFDIRYLEPLLKNFIFNYIPIHLSMINSLKNYLNKISHKNTQFYIARDRRGLENAFIQIANKINGNTNILIHGMMSLDFNKRLWEEGRFKNCKNVYVWGMHDKHVILQRQKILNKSTPKIIINGNPFLKKKVHSTGENILFICQELTNNYIPFFYKNLPSDLNMIIRLHPGTKHELPKYIKYKKKNLSFDNLKDDLNKTLIRSSVVVSYSSTGILEAIYNDIPTLILNFKKLKKKYSSIFTEVPINKNEMDMVLLNDNDYIYKLRKVISDNNYRKKVINLNKKIIKYFVEDLNI